MTSDIDTSTTSPASTNPRTRRMARPPEAVPLSQASATSPSKLDRVEALLLEVGGASIAELMAATGWQQHSVRGAIAGALKKRGLIITSDKNDGTRRYHASRPV